MFRVNVEKWIARELRDTELEVLKAEDELASAQLRLTALRKRAERLRQRQGGVPTRNAKLMTAKQSESVVRRFTGAVVPGFLRGGAG